MRDLLDHLALRRRDNGEFLHLGKFVPELARSAAFEIGLFFVLLFCVGMVCHGETTRRKPPVQRLTLSYQASRKRASVEVRNFYGIASVGIDRGALGAPRGVLLVNGTILLGYQFVDSPKREQPNRHYEIDPKVVGLARSRVTVEAFRLYPRQLIPNGVLAIHITNSPKLLQQAEIVRIGRVSTDSFSNLWQVLQGGRG